MKLNSLPVGSVFRYKNTEHWIVKISDTEGVLHGRQYLHRSSKGLAFVRFPLLMDKEIVRFSSKNAIALYKKMIKCLEKT